MTNDLVEVLGKNGSQKSKASLISYLQLVRDNDWISLSNRYEKLVPEIEGAIKDIDTRLVNLNENTNSAASKISGKIQKNTKTGGTRAPGTIS
ncbi:MAG: hypothetical protein ABIH83_01955 [Candidatus Micrarchaeota archaeon]